MSATSLELLLILLLIGLNGVFAGSEIALVSSRKARLEQQARQGKVTARLALTLTAHPNDFLSAVQIGITLVGILSGALGGATVARRLGHLLARVPGVAPYSQLLSLALVVGSITYLSLVLGELVPKRLALNSPERIACRVARPMHCLARLTAPLVRLLSLSTDGVLNLLGVRPSQEPSITEEEIKVLMEQGTAAGTFEESEGAMVGRIFHLGDRSIKALMTPRTDIDWLDLEGDDETNRQIVINSPHSRFPVCRGSIDNCLGVIRLRSLLPDYLMGQAVDLMELIQPPLYVAENVRALKVLEMFQASGTHIALIMDEYGGVEGLVTLNDLVEAIVGELPTVDDATEPMVIQRQDGSWLLDGLLPLEELKGIMQWESLPRESTGEYHTLAGFVLTLLGHIPTSGVSLEWEGWRLEVVDMDGWRIDKVLLTPLPPPPEQEP
ncbi:Magnesium and cobalt efflux CorC domain protein [Halomicronema hongdechloris C2206]|uniref:Magnesium and cobalt efflux CorC domain protein n=1 Tax=Halomicronema hongdechloris C2206 TaxID=1641165 RepID=A0A1Z3HPS2_9CYAN|nr:hemolysin family protein [Halomicronema hongdechloris]ASC72303.1 Magnesium and cobalt efflux CorC domain protein [Halomicronema hongdechloris C2206]